DVSPGALADEVVRLAWVPPSEAALLALARGGPAAWPIVRRDPGALLLLLRVPSLARFLPDHFSPPALVELPEVLEAAVSHLRRASESSLLDWSDPRRVPVLDACVAYAREAHDIASRLGTCDPERAWTVGLLAPLGWIAVAV